MKRNKTEKRIFKAADALTPEPPSFESATKGIDWDAVAQSARPAPKRRRILIPTLAAGLGLCVAAAIAIPLATHSSPSPETINYGKNGHRAVSYGAFKAHLWRCYDINISFSDSTIEVDKEEAEGPSNASLFEKNGDYACSVHFSGSPFASFEFGTLSYTVGGYQGEAAYLGEKLLFRINFPSDTRITVGFNNASSSIWGYAHYGPIH